MVLVLRQKVKLDFAEVVADIALGMVSPAPSKALDLRRFLREMDSDCMESVMLDYLLTNKELKGLYSKSRIIYPQHFLNFLPLPQGQGAFRSMEILSFVLAGITFPFTKNHLPSSFVKTDFS